MAAERTLKSYEIFQANNWNDKIESMVLLLNGFYLGELDFGISIEAVNGNGKYLFHIWFCKLADYKLQP